MKRKRTKEEREKLREELARSEETVKMLRELAERAKPEIERERARRAERERRMARPRLLRWLPL